MGTITENCFSGDKIWRRRCFADMLQGQYGNDDVLGMVHRQRTMVYDSVTVVVGAAAETMSCS